MHGHVLIAHLLTMPAVKSGFCTTGGGVLCLLPANIDNMSISPLFQDKVTRVNLSYNSKREVLIESDADLSWEEVNEFHVVI